MQNDTVVFYSTRKKQIFPLFGCVLQYSLTECSMFGCVLQYSLTECCMFGCVLQYSLTECYNNKSKNQTRPVKKHQIRSILRQVMLFFGKIIFILSWLTQNKGSLRLCFHYRLIQDNKIYFLSYFPSQVIPNGNIPLKWIHKIIAH